MHASKYLLLTSIHSNHNELILGLSLRYHGITIDNLDGSTLNLIKIIKRPLFTVHIPVSRPLESADAILYSGTWRLSRRFNWLI